MSSLQPLDFSRILRTDVPLTNINERAQGYTMTRIFAVSGRYFIHDTFYRENSKARRMLDIYDLYFNRILHSYDLIPILASLDFKISISYTEYAPYSLNRGLLWSSGSLQEIEFKDKAVLTNGDKVRIHDCQLIFGIDFLNSTKDMVCVAFRAQNNSHWVGLFARSNLAELKRIQIGVPLHNMQIVEVYPSFHDDNVIYLMKFQRFDEIERGLSYGCNTLKWNTQENALETINVADHSSWPTSKNVYLSGAWRSQFFICCIHKLDVNEFKQTRVFLFNLDSKNWSQLVLPFNEMISLSLDVIQNKDEPLIFCAYDSKITETRSYIDPLAFVKSFYRLPTGRPETLEILCRIAAINSGIYEARVKCEEHLKQIKAQSEMLRQLENELELLQLQTKNSRLNIENLKQAANTYEKEDRTTKLPEYLNFKMDI